MTKSRVLLNNLVPMVTLKIVGDQKLHKEHSQLTRYGSYGDTKNCRGPEISRFLILHKEHGQLRDLEYFETSHQPEQT